MINKIKKLIKKSLIKLKIKEAVEEAPVKTLEEKVIELACRGFKDEFIINELNINKHTINAILKKAGLIEEVSFIEEVPAIKATVEEAPATQKNYNKPVLTVQQIKEARKRVEEVKKQLEQMKEVEENKIHEVRILKPFSLLTTEEKKEVIKLYYSTNLIQRLIGEKVGCSQSAVSRVIREAGISYKKIRVEEAVVVGKK